MKRTLQRWWRYLPPGQARWAAGLLLVFALLSVGAPWLAPYNPNEQVDVAGGRYLPPGSQRTVLDFGHGKRELVHSVERTPTGVRVERLGRQYEVPAEQIVNLTASGLNERRVFLLGTDKFGRDLLSRWLYGTRVSLMIGVAALLIGMFLGVSIGALAALSGRWVDGLIMRCIDALMAFPWIFLLIALTAMLRVDVLGLALLMGFTSWMEISRLTRSELLVLKERDFVHAARGFGVSPLRVFVQHLLPNVMTPLVVAGTLRIGQLILIEASISFLGFGVQLPQSSWGNMISEGRGQLGEAWWIATVPGVSLVLVVIAIAVVADGLRDALDPHIRDASDLETLAN